MHSCMYVCMYVYVSMSAGMNERMNEFMYACIYVLFNLCVYEFSLCALVYVSLRVCVQYLHI